MLAYYFNLAVRSFKRNKVLTALMVLAVALGIGASMTTLTVFHVLSGDPIPAKSDKLFYVQLDPFPMNGYTPGGDPAPQLTRFDAETLLREKRADRQAMMSAGSAAVEPETSGLAPFILQARYTTADFFPMFDAPFAHGQAWSASDDAARARVAVISSELSQKLFGDADPTGRTLRLGKVAFRVIGVLGDWNPNPRFYDLTNNRYSGDPEEIYVPFSAAMDLKWSNSGNMNCWSDSDGDSTDLNAPCIWVQYWAQLDSAQKAADYRAYLSNYSDQQRAAGRFQRPSNVRLSDVMTWLDFNQVVPSDVRLQAWLALGFLAVCLLNTVGLLLAKFLRRGGEIGVRRALGASRADIFKQCLVEAGTVGLAGGVLGLGIALLGLWAVRHQPTEYAALAHLDTAMLLGTFVLAIASSLLAGMVPAWRAMQVTPAIQLKSQ
ncbi:putative ABC transport system permease protein [Pseudoxanthomonas sp. GM95]|uniref:ABC transporter permease n=1 Tax=Pseudoxanthomonas sp. GM95 TaxID=1881043 RepID=UPI0008BD292C|nr:ABC transporter permease [Pseudoxanthomonas sp. GM95]SEL45329.1 putative ABC transport system permease protein [Pseudoxanthomonas sp. GM95]